MERIYRALQEVRGGARVDSPTAATKYKALERYSIDLTEAARQNNHDPVIGREDEINTDVVVAQSPIGQDLVQRNRQRSLPLTIIGVVVLALLGVAIGLYYTGVLVF